MTKKISNALRKIINVTIFLFIFVKNIIVFTICGIVELVGVVFILTMSPFDVILRRRKKI